MLLNLLENNIPFYDSLLKDKIIMDKIPVNILKKLFDFNYHTRKINVIFKRVLKKMNKGKNFTKEKLKLYTKPKKKV